MVTVGQSVIWAMVMMSSVGSPLYVCAVGEGPFSLNHPQSHYYGHLSCSILKVGHPVVTCFCLLSLCFQGVACEEDKDPCAGL